MSETAIFALNSILHSDVSSKFEMIKSGASKLSHYTSAENGLKIIDGEIFWLRNTRCMNDFSEIDHGKNLIFKCLTANDRKLISRLEGVLNNIDKRIFKKFAHEFGGWADAFSDIFIGCLSEHEPDDHQGRLSMWRAYGSSTGGVCFVFNSEPFVADTDKLSAFSMPVTYYSDKEFEAHLESIPDQIEEISASLSGIDPDRIASIISNYFIFKAVSLKHPGFSEEREWRIILLPDFRIGEAVGSQVVSVRGLPQRIYTIPLQNDPEKGLFGADIPNLISKVIIGPCDQPYVVWDAYVNSLKSKGVADPEEKVIVSGIPLRVGR